MNGKFYNLSREKQDRMLNAAIKVFALNGYERASTDSIITEAGISKGLIFHYFGNKINLYNYTVEYCARYIIMELSQGISGSCHNFFDRVILVEKAKLRMLKVYPYLDLFMITCSKETAEEVVDISKRWSEALSSEYNRIIDMEADDRLMRLRDDAGRIYESVRYFMSGYKQQHYDMEEEPERVLEGMLPYLEVLKHSCMRD